MTTAEARKIANEISGGVFGAGASETLRLGNLAVQVIRDLADQLDGHEPPEEEAADDAEPAKKRGRPKKA